MRYRADRTTRLMTTAFLLGTVLSALPVFGGVSDSGKVAASAQDQLWRQSIDLAGRGEFSAAAAAARQLRGGGEQTERVRAWLDEYEARQRSRLEMNRADSEKYVGYAKARIERKEYGKALGWVLAAADVAKDRDALLAEEWVSKLVNDALATTQDHRKDNEWREAWSIYSQLAALYEREPRYQKLESEAVSHLRLDAMFKENSTWEERLERVRWKDAKSALEFIGLYYVEPPDFKQIAEGGIGQLLILANSQSAQERFDGLKNENDRNDFINRLAARLSRIQAAPSLDRADCVRHFRRVVQDINRETVRLPDTLIVHELMRGALEPLDDFTTMIWPQEAEEFDKHTRGDFIGVGISIIKNRLDEIEVVTPLADTPAYRAGIQAGDVITHVDGTSLKNYSTNKVVHTITGPRDTAVTLTIRRGKETIEFPLVRAKVKIQSVKGWQRDENDQWNFWRDEENGIAYIRLENFQRNTPEDLQNAMSELQAQGVKGLILDLRWNPGGLLDAAWQVSSLFLKRGDTVVSTKGRIKAEDHQFFAPGDGPYSDTPVVVLVDDSSASASEIVSGAIRDNRRGVVVGERTFGKFSVQNLIPLGPSKAKLKITTARYYLPSGVSLHREPTSETWGVEPDIQLTLIHKERIKVRAMRRKASLLGPARPELDDDDTKDNDEDGKSDGDSVDEKTDDAKKADDVSKDADEAGDEKVADANKKDELPPLDQPDENNRPDEDPQVDAALLILRMKLLDKEYATLATAERNTPRDQAHP